MLQIVKATDPHDAEARTHDDPPRRDPLEQPRATSPLGLVGTSAGIRRLRQFVAQMAPLSAPVVIYGESGSGKERVARALHDNGLTPVLVSVDPACDRDPSLIFSGACPSRIRSS